MGNNELLGSLSTETKNYFDDVFSYLEYFLLNDNTKSNGSLVKINEEDYLAYSFLLATIKDDKVLKDIFDKYDLDLKKLEHHLNIESNSVRHIKSENSSYVKANDLITLFYEISERLKYNNYLENTDINLSELRPYQIFDYMLENYYETYRELCEELSIDIEKDLALDLCKRVYDNDSDFAKKHGVDIDEESEKELDEGTIIKGLYNGDRKTDNELRDLIEPNRFYQLTGFYGFKEDELTRDNIDRVINNKDFKVVFNRHQLFKKKALTIEEENQITLNEIMSSVREEENTKEYTPYLDKYGFDLTKDKYLKDPSVGREDKLRELEKILLYPEKDKSILVTGIAGCGKTALVKGLAYRIQKGDVPEDLKNLHIISIDCASLVAGTKYVGTLEEKMKNILDEASTSKNIVLFMDEIHQALGAGKAEGNDNSVSEILKPYLDYGRVRVIGATTDYEYSEYVEQDPAFETRFKQVKVKEPDDYIVYQILDELIESYNKFSYSKLLVSDDERDMIIKWLMDSTISRNRDCRTKSSNPRLVLDILKDAYALAALDSRTEVSINDLQNALLQEERLYKSSRERQAQQLGYMKPKKKECEVIQFRLTK